jgi:hypothetical protein
MSKQPDVYKLHETMGNHAGSPSKDEGDTSGSGSFHDQADMQRLGKEQELKVRRSIYSLSRSQNSGRIAHTGVNLLMNAACLPQRINPGAYMCDHGDLGSHVQHGNLLLDQRRKSWYSMAVHCDLDADHSRICISC